MQKLSQSQAMSMHNTSNLQKELLAMSVAAAASMNATKDDSQMKPKKGKNSSRSNYSQNKSLPQQFQTSSRSKDGAYDNPGSYTPTKSTNDILQGYSR